MAKYPEYKESRKITPHAQPGGQREAVSGVIQSIDSFATLCSNVASNVATEQAIERGRNDAQNPGLRKIKTPITKVDIAYNQAYLEESGKVLSNKANQLLDNFSFEFSKIPNPTGNDVNQIQIASQKGLSDLLEKADPKIRNQLKRNFEAKLNSNILQYSRSVEKANVKRLHDNFKYNTETNSSNMFDYFNNKLPLDAKNSYDEQIKNIDSITPYIGDTKAKEYKKAARITFETAKHEAIMMSELEDNGETAAAEYIQDLSDEEKVKNLSNTEKIGVVKQLYNKLLQIKKINRLQDNIILQRAEKDLLTDKLSQEKLIGYHVDLSEEAFNKLQIAILKKQGKQHNSDELLNFANENADNLVALDSMSKDQKNDVYNSALKEEKQRLNRELGIDDYANAASRYDMAIPAFNDKVNRGILSNNPALTAKWSQIYNGLFERNPNVVSKVSTKAQGKAKSIYKDLLAGYTQEEAINNYTNNQKQINQAGDKVMISKYKTEKEMRKLNNEISRTKQLAQMFKVDDNQISGNFISDFDDLQRRAYIDTGDWNLSLELAKQNMHKTWRMTTINGFPQMMKFAPEVYYQGYEDKIHDQLKNEITKIVNDSQIAYKNEDIPTDYYFEFDKGYKEIGKEFLRASVSGEPIRPSSARDKRFHVIRYDNLGNVKRGTLRVVPDSKTAWKKDNEGTSYSIMFFDDDKNKLIPSSVIGKFIGDKYEYQDNRFKVNQSALFEKREVRPEELKLLQEWNKEALAIQQKIKSSGFLEGYIEVFKQFPDWYRLQQKRPVLRKEE